MKNYTATLSPELLERKPITFDDLQGIASKFKGFNLFPEIRIERAAIMSAACLPSNRAFYVDKSKRLIVSDKIYVWIRWEIKPLEEILKSLVIIPLFETLGRNAFHASDAMEDYINHRFNPYFNDDFKPRLFT